MNNVSLLGRLTRDVEMRYTQNETAVCNFSLAVNRRFKRDEADFINIVAWGKTAEFCSKYFVKGQQIALQGRIETSTYEVEGQKRYKAEVVAEAVYFAEKKGEGQGNYTEKEAVSTSEDDLPF